MFRQPANKQKIAENKKWAIAHWSASPNEFSIVNTDEVEA